MCGDGNVRKQDLAGQRIDRACLDGLPARLDESPDPGEIDRRAGLSEGRRVEIDREDPSASEACPGLGEQPGSAPDVDGIARWQTIERRKAHHRGGVIARAEPAAGCLHQLTHPAGRRGVAIAPPIPPGDQGTRAVGPHRDRGYRRDRQRT